MSNENTQTPNSKATNVATDLNNADDLTTSEFIIISSDEHSETENNLNVSNGLVVNASITEKERERKEKSISTKTKNSHQNKIPTAANAKNKKSGLSAITITLIKQRQEERKKADLAAKEHTDKNQSLLDDHDQKTNERICLKNEHSENIKDQENKYIRRPKIDRLYLTKQQRKKYEHARMLLESVGISVPTHRMSQLTISNNGEAHKKRILYDSPRKTNANKSIQLTTISIESETQMPIEDEDSPIDTWEYICYKEQQTSSTIEDSDNEQELEIISDKNSESESTDNEDNPSLVSANRAHYHIEQDQELNEHQPSSDTFRAPVICVLGHVDAGKTSILDNLRRTHVQNNEAGGITQQIGATNVPLETISERTKMYRDIISHKGDILIPGLLIIDTPGHETFKNLRSRGSSLCDLSILVVDIMHGLAPQTIESIQLLIERQTPFIIALNKIDLLYNWKSNKEKNIQCVLQEQTTLTQNQFEKRCNHIIVQFAEQGLNVALYYNNPDPNEYYSMVPISARTEDGMGSLIALIIEKCQTNLAKRIIYTNKLKATVMEVKTNENLGTTIDVVLVNGCLSIGDKIILAGQESPIITRIRRILIPESNQELRVTNQYQSCNKIQGACGVKIVAKDLEKSMAGFPLFVIQNDDDIDYYKTIIDNMLTNVLNSIELNDKGVYVQASTLGSLEAFIQLLKTSKIPYSGVNIGPVHRKDVIRVSTQLEKDIEWATILAFDVKIERDAQEYANTIGVKIFQHDEIYRLRDMFISHKEDMKKIDQEKYRYLAVFPCKLRIVPGFIFNSRDPIICGVYVEDGFIKLGTPICIPSKDYIDLGRIISIEKNHKSLDIAHKHSEVCIKIEPIANETPKMYGRHFDANDILMSKISRESIDIVKAYFRNEMQRCDWLLMLQLKKVFQIQ